MECTAFSKNYGKERARRQKDDLNNLQTTKCNLQEELFRQSDNKECSLIQAALDSVESQIKLHEEQITNASIFRSKCNWVRYGETSSKFFFGLEKWNYLSKNMKCVVRDSGEVSYYQGIILEEQTKFYKSLYTRHVNDVNAKFNIKRESYDPMLSDKFRDKCNVEITVHNLYDAVLMMKANKVGGPDGSTAKYYRTFFHDIKHHLLAMYKYAYQQGCLSPTTWKGLISLLPKKNKDTRYVKNMRPLTLLNIDYKILAKVMDNHLRDVAPLLIHRDQTGFMAGRHINVNIRKLLDVMEYCKNTSTPAVIMSIDMEKCFDCIEHEVIFETMHIFNFGEKYIRWVSLFYKNFLVCMQNQGYMSKWFEKTRSINQGCNISPSIYLLVGELLALRLCNHKQIHGINIGMTEVLISQFADDMDLYLPYEKQF